eukprot:1190044-Prorocentrum_minimum.AAC.2
MTRLRGASPAPMPARTHTFSCKCHATGLLLTRRIVGEPNPKGAGKGKARGKQMASLTIDFSKVEESRSDDRKPFDKKQDTKQLIHFMYGCSIQYTLPQELLPRRNKDIMLSKSIIDSGRSDHMKKTARNACGELVIDGSARRNFSKEGRSSKCRCLYKLPQRKCFNLDTAVCIQPQTRQTIRKRELKYGRRTCGTGSYDT